MSDPSETPEACDIHLDGNYVGSIEGAQIVHGYTCGCAWGTSPGNALPSWRRRVFRDDRPLARITRGGRGV